MIAGLLLYILQDKFIYLPGNEIFRTPKDEGMEYEDLDFYTKDGVFIHAWFIPNGNKDKVVLFCHGNAGSLSNRIDTIKMIYDLGFSVFIFDYRGYGISEGKTSEAGTSMDAEAALMYLLDEKKIPEERIIVWGRSLGGAIAAKLAGKRKIAACVLESSFTSIPDMAKWRFKIFPSRLLAKYSYSTIDYVKEIDAPLFIVHSEDDEIIPYWMGKQIFSESNKSKMFLKLKGDHNNTYFDSVDEYQAGLNEFFDKFNI